MLALTVQGEVVPGHAWNLLSREMSLSSEPALFAGFGESLLALNCQDSRPRPAFSRKLERGEGNGITAFCGCQARNSSGVSTVQNEENPGR
jgi:hypothetical protein